MSQTLAGQTEETRTEENGPPQTGPHPGRQFLKRAAKFAALALAALLVALLALLWRLSRGPISLSFLTERIEQRVGPLIDPLSLELDDVVLAYRNRRQPLSLRVRGLRLYGSAQDEVGGEPLVEFDDTGVLLSMKSLLRGQLRVVGVELTGLRVTVVRNEEGKFEIGLARHRSATGDHPDIAQLVERFVGPDKNGLQRVRLVDAALEVEDRRLDLDWGAEQFELDLVRSGPSELTAQMTADLEVGDSSTALSLDATYDLGTRVLEGRLSVPEVIPGHVGPPLYQWGGWAALDRSVALEAAVTAAVNSTDDLELNTLTLRIVEEHLEIQTSADFAGALDSLSGTMQVARLDLASFSALDPRLSVLEKFGSRLRGDALFALESGRVQHVEIGLEGAEPETDPGRVEASIDFRWQEGEPDEESPGLPPEMSGSVSLARLDPRLFASLAEPLAPLQGVTTPVTARIDFALRGRAVERLDGDVTLGAGEIHLEEIYPEPIQLSRASFRGAISEELATIRLTEGRAQLGDKTVSVELDANRTDAGYDLVLRGELDGFGIEEGLELWPPKVISGARAWLVENLSGAELGHGTLEIDGSLALARPGAGQAAEPSPAPEPSPPLSIERLSASLPFAGLDLQILPPGLVVEGIDGTAEFSLEAIDFAIERAHLHDVALSDSTVTLGLTGEIPLSVDAKMAGPASTVVKVLSSDSLAVIEPDLLAGVEGQLGGRLQLSLPLGGDEGLTAKQVDVSANAHLERVSWQDAPFDLDLENGDLLLELADGEIEVAGGIDARGTRADGIYRQSLEEKGRIELQVSSRVDQATARAFGIPEQEYVEGEMVLQARYTAQGGEPGRVTVNADLTPLGMDFPEIGWSKDASAPGKAEVEIRLGDQGAVSIERFELNAADLEIAGTAEVSTGPFLLQSVELPTLRFLESRTHLSIERQAEDDYLVQLGGEQLDLTPSFAHFRDRLERGRASAVEETAPPRATNKGMLALTIEIALQRLALPQQVTVSGFLGNSRIEGGNVEELHLVGKLGETGMVEASLLSPDTGPEFDLASTDVAILVGVLGKTSMAGGNVRLTANQPAPDALWRGHLEMNDFVFLDQPDLARVLSLASLRGLTEVFQDTGFEIKSLESDFALDRQHLEVINAKAYGPALFATVHGKLDFPTSTMDIRGSVAPASTLQRVLGKIPIVNWLLTGRDGEGVLATRFALTGPISGPEVKVQPLSSLTPAITREILDTFRSNEKEGPP